MKNSIPEIISDLSLAIYNMYEIDNLDSTDDFQRIIDMYRLNYSGQEVERIMVALEWALNNRQYDFRGILPNMEFSDAQIITFMENLLGALEKAFDRPTLATMMVPSDARNLRILILDDLKYDHTEIKFAHTMYAAYEIHNPVDSIRKYLEDDYDLFILSLNQSKNNTWNFLIDLREAKSQMESIKTPVLILLEDENDVSLEKMSQLGFRDHLPLPVPTYLLLQEVYRITSMNK